MRSVTKLYSIYLLYEYSKRFVRPTFTVALAPSTARCASRPPHQWPPRTPSHGDLYSLYRSLYGWRRGVVVSGVRQ